MHYSYINKIIINCLVSRQLLFFQQNTRNSVYMSNCGQQLVFAKLLDVLLWKNNNNKTLYSTRPSHIVGGQFVVLKNCGRTSHNVQSRFFQLRAAACVVMTSWLAEDQQVHQLVETAQISVRSTPRHILKEKESLPKSCGHGLITRPLCRLGKAVTVVDFRHYCTSLGKLRSEVSQVKYCIKTIYVSVVSMLIKYWCFNTQQDLILAMLKLNDKSINLLVNQKNSEINSFYVHPVVKFR